MFDLQELYQEIVMDHNRRPRNFGALENPTNQANGFNPVCGDEVTVFLEVLEGKIIDVSFNGVGCAISKSSASMMTESVKGKSLEQAKAIFESFRKMITKKPGEEYKSEILGDLEILQRVSQYPTRIKCATLSWHALQSVLDEDDDTVTTE